MPRRSAVSGHGARRRRPRPTAPTRRSTGRITRYPAAPAREGPADHQHRDITLMRRWMDAMGVDMACMFPTPMLNLATCPRVEVEVALAQAYNRWLCDKILGGRAALQVDALSAVQRSGGLLQDRRGIRRPQGRHRLHGDGDALQGVYDNAYVKTYAALQERNLPLGFHAAFTWATSPPRFDANRFIAVHALGFAWYNMLHMTNWVMNGMPERFPRLKTVWIESGLAWVPVPDAAPRQRIHDAHVRTAPLLKRKPSDYMREMFYTSQPMEMVDNTEALELTFKMIKAETPAAVFVGLSALGHGSAEHDLRSAVPPGRASEPFSEATPRSCSSSTHTSPPGSSERLKQRSLASRA